MAWVTEYDLTWRSNNALGKIELQRDEGSYQSGLTLRRGSLEIVNTLPNWEAGVVRGNCSFTVVNDLSDFYELIPLMTISTGQIRVVVTETSPTTTTMFEGFLNSEVINQDMLHKSDLRFTASGLLNKLDDNYPVEIDTLQNMSLFDIIDDCLLLTGATYNIRVNCSLYEVNSVLGSGQTLFNKTALFSEITWKNNVDRLTALEILEMIMASFDCHLFWRQGYWYIQHYQDIGNTLDSPYERTYVEYTSGVSYEYADSGSNQVVGHGAPMDIHDPTNRPQISGSQVLSVIPGMREIEIRLDQKQYFNLINGDLTDSVDNNDPYPLAANREWLSYDGGLTNWRYRGLPHRNIANSILRNQYDVTLDQLYANGLTTGFKMTVQDDTVLELRWKHGLWGSPPGSNPIEDYTISHNYWVAVIIPWVSTQFLVYGESAGQWVAVTGSPAISLQTIEKEGGDYDPDLRTIDISVSISIGEAMATSADWEQDVTIQFGIGTEQFADGVITPQPAAWGVFGDVEASITETPPNNIIKGTQNTDFLNKKKISLLLFNSGFSYRNILLRGSTLGPLYHARATDWTYNGTDIDDLSRWLMASKFRFYNVARQKIQVNYNSIEKFWPLGLWLDNKQSDKKFVLLSDIHLPESDQHELILSEYDDTEEINFV